MARNVLYTALHDKTTKISVIKLKKKKKNPNTCTKDRHKWRDIQVVARKIQCHKDVNSLSCRLNIVPSTILNMIFVVELQKLS